MVRRLAHAEVADERAQTVALETRHQRAGEFQGVEDLVGEWGATSAAAARAGRSVDIVPDENTPSTNSSKRGMTSEIGASEPCGPLCRSGVPQRGLSGAPG